MNEERLWLLERGSVPPCYCPFESPDVVVTGLSWLGMPPGQVVGEFSLDEAGSVQIRLSISAVEECKAQEKGRNDE